MKDLILTIDTSSKDQIVVSLVDGDKTLDSITENNSYGSQVLLPAIMELIKKNKFKLEDLSSISVNTGPGSFTGLRVGVSVANALGFALGVKVNEKQMETSLKYS